MRVPSCILIIVPKPFVRFNHLANPRTPMVNILDRAYLSLERIYIFALVARLDPESCHSGTIDGFVETEDARACGTVPCELVSGVKGIPPSIAESACSLVLIEEIFTSRLLSNEAVNRPDIPNFFVVLISKSNIKNLLNSHQRPRIARISD